MNPQRYLCNRASSTLKILAPSLLSQKGKGWTTFTPPAAAPCRRFRGLVSHCRSHKGSAVGHDEELLSQEIDSVLSSKHDKDIQEGVVCWTDKTDMHGAMAITGTPNLWDITGRTQITMAAARGGKVTPWCEIRCRHKRPTHSSEMPHRWQERPRAFRSHQCRPVFPKACASAPRPAACRNARSPRPRAF